MADNEVLTRFTAVDEELQAVAERTNKTIGQVAEKHQQAHFSMRHALSLTAAATGGHTAELMHFYYAITMIPGPVGVAVAVLLLFKSQAEAAGKAYEDMSRLIKETDISVNATFRQHQHEQFGGERGGKAMDEYVKNREKMAELRHQIDEESKFGWTGVMATAFHPETLASAVSQYEKLAGLTGTLAQNVTNEVAMGEKDWEYINRKFELERNLNIYSKDRVENLKKEEELLEDQVMDQDEMNKKLKGRDLSKGQERFIELAKQLKQMRESHAELEDKTQTKTQEYRNKEISIIQGPQMAAYEALNSKMTRELYEAHARGQDELASQIEATGTAQMGKMGIDAQRELQSKQKIGFSGLADFWKSFQSNQMTPAEREHLAELRKIAALLAPFAAKVAKQREGGFGI